MKLSDWAKSQGISYQTAYRSWTRGDLPVPAYKMASGRIIVDLNGTGPRGTRVVDEKQLANIGAKNPGCALYARVSSHDQKEDLTRQMTRLREGAKSAGLVVVSEVHEIGSGLNGHRPQLLKLLSDPSVEAIMVEHRDRLMRFGAEYVEAALAASGRSLIVLDSKELDDDLVQDMIDVLTSFCARLYGRRSAGRRSIAALAAVHAHEESTPEQSQKST